MTAVVQHTQPTTSGPRSRFATIAPEFQTRGVTEETQRKEGARGQGQCQTSDVLFFGGRSQAIASHHARNVAQVSGWGPYCQASVGFLLLPVAPSVSCLSVNALHTRSSKLPPPSTISRCLPLSTTRLCLLPNPHPQHVEYHRENG